MQNYVDKSICQIVLADCPVQCIENLSAVTLDEAEQVSWKLAMSKHKTLLYFLEGGIHVIRQQQQLTERHGQEASAGTQVCATQQPSAVWGLADMHALV